MLFCVTFQKRKAKRTQRDGLSREHAQRMIKVGKPAAPNPSQDVQTHCIQQRAAVGQTWEMLMMMMVMMTDPRVMSLREYLHF